MHFHNRCVFLFVTKDTQLVAVVSYYVVTRRPLHRSLPSHCSLLACGESHCLRVGTVVALHIHVPCDGVESSVVNVQMCLNIDVNSRATLDVGR